MNKMPPPEGYDDNPEWTDATSARARPAGEVLPAQAVAALVKRPRGRPPGSDKGRTSIRLDQEVIDHYKAAGPGWQTRINEDLRKAAGL